MKGMMLKVSKNWMLLVCCMVMVGRVCFAVAAEPNQSEDLLTSTTQPPTTLGNSTLPPINTSTECDPTSTETSPTPVPSTSPETSTSTNTTVKPPPKFTKSPPTEPPTTKSQSGNSGEDNGNNGSGGSGSGRSDDSNGSRAGSKGKNSADDGGLSLGVIIAIVVASLLVLAFLIVASIFAVRHFLKKKKNENADIEANNVGHAPKKDGPEDFKPKPVKIQKPSDAAALKTYAPLKFKKMGALRIQTKKPDVVPDLLSIKSEKSSQSTRNYEVHWDNENNEVYDIGSDVEILMDGDVPLPKKPKAAKTPAKTPVAAARTSGRKTKLTEKQRDKAIRE